ncbi:MAG: dimethylarginine dimethylaminohydrolase [Pseudomonadota bacterium]
MSRSCTFTHTLSRAPSRSVARGLRAEHVGDPDFDRFADHHAIYIAALEAAGCKTEVLPALEAFPDSVFIEDAALCLGPVAIALRPGAPSRFGETSVLRPELERIFSAVIDLPGTDMADGALVDGGDILVTETEILVGLSQRTDQTGFDALADIARDLGYTARAVHTPKGVLHFKSDCGLLDEETIFATAALAASGCFEGYRIIEAPRDEDPAANLIRVNDHVLVSDGYPRTAELLDNSGYDVVTLPNSEAAKIDGGLSCMSLRFNLTTP